MRMRLYFLTFFYFLLLNCSNAFIKQGNSFFKAKLKVATFDEYSQIPEWLKINLKKNEFLNPTEVQQQVLPELFACQDLVIQSKTGSGKTLAFTIPLLAKINPERTSIQAVIFEPTRELCLQVSQVIRQLSSSQNIQVMNLMDGSFNKRQQQWLLAETPHIIVANPLSFLNFINTGKLKLNGVNYVVVDEVDASILVPDSKNVLHQILSHYLSPTYLDQEILEFEVSKHSFSQEHKRFRGSRQTILCSATIPQRSHFAATCKKNMWTQNTPIVIDVSQDRKIPETISHEYVVIEIENKISLVSYLLKSELSKDTALNQTNQYIVFSDGKYSLTEYSEFLNLSLQKKFNLSTPIVSMLSEDMNIEDRMVSIKKFQKGESKILICSDLGARGLDIPFTSLVIQMSLPNNADQYLHRAGRTGRFGREGKVFVLLGPKEIFALKRFTNEMNFEIKEKRIMIKN